MTDQADRPRSALSSALLDRRRLLAAGALLAAGTAVRAADDSKSRGMRTISDRLVTPEGPIALDDGSVLVVEIIEGRLTRVAPDGTTSVVATTGGGPNGATIGPDGACYIANNGGFASAMVNGKREMRPGLPADYRGGSIQRVDLRSGAVTTLYAATKDVPLRGPNDLVCDGDGGLWITDLGKMTEAAMDFGAIYWAAADGSGIRKVDGRLVTPNGIALSPDRRTLYVACTETRQVLAYDVVGRGQVALGPNGRPRRRILASLGGGIGFDSMAVEESGNLVVGTLMEGGGLTVISPSGAVIDRILIDGGATNVAFGGPGRRTLFVTQTQDGRLFSMPWPRPGLKLAHR